MSRHNVYRGGRVHVRAERCATCVFRAGNPMELRRGRVREMIEEARANESAIVCHATLGTGANAVCRGFFDRHATAPLEIADRLGLVAWVGGNDGD